MEGSSHEHSIFKKDIRSAAGMAGGSVLRTVDNMAREAALGLQQVGQQQQAEARNPPPQRLWGRFLLRAIDGQFVTTSFLRVRFVMRS